MTDDVLRHPDRLFGSSVFDLDGTLDLGDAPIPGAPEMVAAFVVRDVTELLPAGAAERRVATASAGPPAARTP